MSETTKRGTTTGYAYQWGGSAVKGWSNAPDETWDTVVITGEPQAAHLGVRRIDGSLCNVWRHKDGSIVAQVRR